jgi:uncharacterized protein (TIGR00297 family)
MEQEMHKEGWRKAIPRERDRAQSRALVGVVGLLLAGLSCDTVRRAVVGASPLVWEALAVSAGFALVVLGLRAATAGGAVCGGMICLLVTLGTGSGTGRGFGWGAIGRSGLAPLGLLFVLTFLATRAGRGRKARAGLAEGRRGRSAAQVIANLSVAGLCAAPAMGWVLRWDLGWNWGWNLKAMCLAALVEATADTVSSEIGQAFGGEPVMLTSLRRVAAGTDGAVTVLGTLAGVGGGGVVALAGGWAMGLEFRVVAIVLGAGVCGLLFDSLLGATVERRGWVGNDLVNFASTVFAAGVAGVGCWVVGLPISF